MIPAYAPSVPNWMREASIQLNPLLSRFRGSATFNQEDFVGFTFVPDIAAISYIDAAGTSSAPTTNVQPISLLAKHSNVNASLNPAFAAQHNVYATGSGNAGQSAFFETIIRVGGTGVFGEGNRSHTIVPNGLNANSYGSVSYGQNGGNGLYNIGHESEIRRTITGDRPLGRAWTSTDKYDACYNATAQTTDATVGGVGGKPSAAFGINPFNSIAVQTGFWIPRSVVGSQTVAHTAFGCQEGGLVYGLDLAKGSYSTAAIAIPNNSAVTAFNAAGSSEYDIMRLDGSDWLRLNTGGSGNVSFGTITANADAPVTGYITIKDNAGTTRKLAVIA